MGLKGSAFLLSSPDGNTALTTLLTDGYPEYNKMWSLLTGNSYIKRDYPVMVLSGYFPILTFYELEKRQCRQLKGLQRSQFCCFLTISSWANDIIFESQLCYLEDGGIACNSLQSWQTD